jgi:hypothetical protein
MDPDHRTNILTARGFAAGVFALGALITVMLVWLNDTFFSL